MNNFGMYLTKFELLSRNIDLVKLNNIIQMLEKTMNKNNIYICGNGGSFSTAQHFAQDLGRVEGINADSVGNNPSRLTAYSNDFGYKEALVSELDGKLRLGDIVIIISCSGNSENIIEVAKYCNGYIRIIGLLGNDGGEVAKYCTESIIIPLGDYGLIESIHSMLCHFITTELFEREKLN